MVCGLPMQQSLRPDLTAIQEQAVELLNASPADYQIQYKGPSVTAANLDTEPSETLDTPRPRRYAQHNRRYWAVFIEDNYIPYLVTKGLNNFRFIDLSKWIEREPSVLNAEDLLVDGTGRPSWKARISHSLGELVLDGILKRNRRNGQHYTVTRFRTGTLTLPAPHHPV